jgi:hypothetical protein
MSPAGLWRDSRKKIIDEAGVTDKMYEAYFQIKED